MPELRLSDEEWKLVANAVSEWSDGYATVREAAILESVLARVHVHNVACAFGSPTCPEFAGGRLDPVGIAMADLAFIEEPGTPADKVAAAVVAYDWALEWVAADPNRFGPSVADWRVHRVTLGKDLR